MAGIMVRDDLTAGSRHVVAAMTPAHGVSFDYRSSAGGTTTYVDAGAGNLPMWLRITRSGNSFTAYRSANGTAWTSIGSVTIALAATAHIGLIVLSQVNSTLGTATFDNVFVTGGGDFIPPVISAVSAGSINLNGGSISWTTNEPATSQIDYGTTAAYGSQTALNSTLTTSHSLVVSGLQPATLYHYRVRSADAAGNTAVSGDYTFTTTS